MPELAPVMTMSTAPVSIVEGMETGYVANGDLRMYYERHGDAAPGSTPLLLIHGGGSTIDTNWAALLPTLADGREVIAIEEEGHGRTRPTERALTSEASAGDVMAVLDELGVERVDVFAFSAGCQTAIAIALARPERIRRLVLASAPWRRDALIPGFWDGLAAGSLADMPPLFVEEHRRLNGDEPELLQRFFELDQQRMLTFQDWPDDAIAGIAAPTLVVAADRDVVTVESAALLARTVADGRLLVVPGTHGDYLGEAFASGGDLSLMRATAPLLRHFLDATPA
jgi:pimeloyl-ACP methyl ester carboxylesterase